MSHRRLTGGSVRVLRAVVANGGKPGYGYLLRVAGGDQRSVADSLQELQNRFLIRWDAQLRVVRPSRRGVDLLSTAEYRDRGVGFARG